MKPKTCKICSTLLIGRRDKLFCSIRCKNYYHTNLRRVTKNAAVSIDNILHRNRSILLEIMKKTKKPIKIKRLQLDKKKFNFKYHTHTQTNSKGKTYVYIYDFSWMSFSDDEVLITRA
jgi:hypothetical protein